MIREIFDVPDSNDVILARAELFLRERIEQLGGELLKKLEAHDFGEYPSFEAIFFTPEPQETEQPTQDSQELAHEYAEIYKKLDEVHEEYVARFGDYF